MNAPILYLDLGSPYGYLAAERADSVFGRPVTFQPVLLGAIFKRRGWGSWAATEARGDGMAVIERRARRYGLPPFTWPAEWPANALAADRAAIWAKRQGLGERFVRILYRRQFVHGADISDPVVIKAAAQEAGLDGREVREAIASPQIKGLLRQATDEAWELGVRGVPTIAVGKEMFYGDDQLDVAAGLAV